jgi:hypothetical protein
MNMDINMRRLRQDALQVPCVQMFMIH